MTISTFQKGPHLNIDYRIMISYPWYRDTHIVKGTKNDTKGNLCPIEAPIREGPFKGI